MKPQPLTFLLVLLLATPFAPAAEDARKFELKDGDRVAFIGNTFVEREQVDCYIETALTSRYPDRNITFRNLGYSADTVTGEARGLCSGWSQFEAPDKAFERLRKLVAEYRPTVLLINYGMTESFFGPAKLPEFVANYNKMLDALVAAAGTSPHIVLMSPNYHEDLGRPLPDPTAHDANLKLYSEAIADIAAKRGGAFIDLYSLTKNADGLQLRLTTNGIHLNPFGYAYVARGIEDLLQERPRTSVVKLNASGEKTEAMNAKVSDVAVKDGRLSFTAQLTFLPDSRLPATVLKGILDVRQIVNPTLRIVTITDLKPGDYQLKAGDEVVASGHAEEWAKGIPLHGGPDVAQAEVLRKLIVSKNFDYFNYQRPDNDSYILAFRKREQGRNAVEIPQFLPFVEEKEKQIAVLRVPMPVTYTLEPVK